jgi:hypothetical protein
MEGVMGVRCKLELALVASVGIAVLSGCSETLSLANLPGVTKLPEKLLSKEEQQKTVNQMAEKGQTHQAETVKEIEKGK